MVGERPDVGDRRRRLVEPGHAAVAGGEGQEEVAAGVLADTAHAGDTKGRALGQPPALQRQQRRVGGDDADDRATAGRWTVVGVPGTTS